MASYIRRRKFLATLFGAAAWPLAARAQQAAMPVVAFVGGASPEVSARRAAAFSKGLNETGYVEGQNVTVEYHWLEGQYNRLPPLMAELIRRPVAVIAVPGSSPISLAAKSSASVTTQSSLVWLPASLGRAAMRLVLTFSSRRL